MAANSSLGIGSILKYGAIAAGLYMAWKYGLFQTLGLSFLPAPPAAAPALPTAPSGGGDPTASTAGGVLATTPTVTGGGGAIAGQGVLTADQIDTITKNAAAGDVVAAAQATALGIRYRGDQWNWFRATQTHVDAPATPGLDKLYTASEYLAYRASNGLSGVASLGGLPLGSIRIYGARRASFSLGGRAA